MATPAPQGKLDSKGEEASEHKLRFPQIEKLEKAHWIRNHETLETRLSLDKLKSVSPRAAAQKIEDASIEELITLIKSDAEPLSKVEAVQRLSEYINFEGDKSENKIIVSTISDALSDTKQHAFVKTAAAYALGTYIGADIIEETGLRDQVSKGLVNGLYLTGKDSQLVRLSCADALGNLRYAEAIPDLLKAAEKDADKNVRTLAVKALGQFTDEYQKSYGNFNTYITWKARCDEILPKLIDILKVETSEKTILAIAEALGSSGDERAVVPLVNALKRHKSNPELSEDIAYGIYYLESSQKSAIINSPEFKTIIDLAGDSVVNPKTRTLLALILSSSRSMEAVPVLIRNLSDTDSVEEVRSNSAYALGKIKDPQAVPALWSALNKEGISSKERLEIAQALAELEDSRVRDILLDAIKDKSKDRFERSFIGYSLGKLKDSSTVPALLELQKEESPNAGLFHQKALSGLIEASRNDPVTKALFAEEFQLEGRKLDIWNEFGVYIQEGERKIADWQYDRITSLLKSRTSVEKDSLNFISTKVDDKNGPPDFAGIADLTNKSYHLYLPYVDSASWFSKVISHEHAHVKLLTLLKPEDEAKFYEIYNNALNGMLTSGIKNPNVFYFFPTQYSLKHPGEFQAEVESTYRFDTRTMTDFAKSTGSPYLIEQVKLKAKVFSEKTADGRVYTWSFEQKNDGTLIAQKVKMDADGLPTTVLFVE